GRVLLPERAEVQHQIRDLGVQRRRKARRWRRLAGVLRANQADGRGRGSDRRAGQAGSQLTSRPPLIGRETGMKTMTCKDLGGPCEFLLNGSRADEVIKAQDRHLKDMVGSGDDSHQDAFKEMKGRWRHPISGMGWYRATKRAFAALPDG